jgi:hypothetical protein
VTWIVSYRSVSGEVVETHHDTRESAKGALIDQLIDSALTLWKIGETYPQWVPVGPQRRREYFDRGDRFIGHVLCLMDTHAGEFLIVGKQGRQWLLCEVPPEVTRQGHGGPAEVTA